MTPSDMTDFIHLTATLPANSSTSSCSSSQSKNASVTASSQGFGNDLSSDVFSPPVNTQNGKISDCYGSNLAVVSGKEMARVQFVALLAWSAELLQRKLSLRFPSP